jgi:hypothetical protein
MKRPIQSDLSATNGRAASEQHIPLTMTFRIVPPGMVSSPERPGRDGTLPASHTADARHNCHTTIVEV